MRLQFVLPDFIDKPANVANYPNERPHSKAPEF